MKFDHLPDEPIEAASAPETAQMVTTLIRERETLQALPDAEAVQIKRL